MPSNFALMPQRPPYVEFEQRPVEDRTATIEQGSIQIRDVDYAIIRAIGAKDAVEKEALPWLNHLDKMVMQSEYPREWALFFREQYDAWKKGQEIGPNGTHVKNWAAISRAQAEMLIAARILTVEDLAQANEESLQRVGMGARELQARARAWLEIAAKNGAAEELAALRVQNADQKQTIEGLGARIAALEARLAATEDDAGGRKRRVS